MNCLISFIGEVRRQCNLKKDGEASWGEPDYSGCLSSEFLYINNKVRISRRMYYPEKKKKENTKSNWKIIL